MAKRLMVLLGMLAMIMATAVPTLAQEATQYAADGVAEEIPSAGVIEGTVTGISGSVVLVEEDPSDRGDPSGPPESSPNSLKGYFTVTDETELTKQEDGEVVPAAFEDLAVGQSVEATYAEDIALSYPTQGNAVSIEILEEDVGNGNTVVSGDTNNDKGGSGVDTGAPAPSPKAQLPATGGVTLAAAVGALLIAGGLLARRIYR